MSSTDQVIPLNSRSLRGNAVATRARLLAAAERLFAERGIDAVSLSDINRAAGQRNKSALQYHFGSKEGVLHAILDKHTPGIEQRRHALLDEIEAVENPELRAAVEALVLPVVEKLDDPDGGVAFIRVNSQLIGHPRLSLIELHLQRVNRGADRLQRIATRLAEREAGRLPAPLVVPRWLLMTGLLFHGVADYSRLVESRGQTLSVPSRELFVANVVDTLAALMLAPVSATTTRLLPSGKK